MLSFEGKLESGDTFNGSCDDGSWKKIAQLVAEGDKVVGLSIFNDHGGATIDENCDGYLICRKHVADIMSGNQQGLVGIGYWKDPDPMARIKWYDEDSMELQYTEARPIDQCGFFLIRNKKWQ